MRSRLTSSPSARAASTTSGTRSGSCVRSSVASTWGTADCMPKLTRENPPRRSVARDSASTESGFASVVTSAPGRIPQVSSIARRIITRSSAGSIVGVPPPKNTVDTGRRATPDRSRTDAANRISWTA